MHNGNGILVPGWIIKTVLPVLTLMLGSLGYGVVDTNQEADNNRAAVNEACSEVNDLRQTLREIILISAAEPDPGEPAPTARERAQLDRMVDSLAAKDCG